MPSAHDNVCKLVDLQSALNTFASYEGPIQSQAHIKPLHWYVACRLLSRAASFPRKSLHGHPFGRSGAMAGSSVISPVQLWVASGHC
jgi:hypothetical protein